MKCICVTTLPGLSSFACAVVLAAGIAPTASAAEERVSFSKDVQPILNKSCTACHKPAKKKGKLDLTTFAAVMAGGDTGKSVLPGNPKESPLVDQIAPHGDKPPAMPEKGDPLKPDEVAVIARWVEQGAKDDTPASALVKSGYAQPGPPPPAESPTYRVPPAIAAMALSPDGQTLAVAGRAEVLLIATDDREVKARLPLGSARITSVLFADDGKTLYAAGGTPGVFGHVVAWDVASREVRHNWRVSADTVFGLSVSPDGTLVAVGCADRTTRVIALDDGKEVLNVQAHTDWVFGTALSADGSQVLSTGRDKSLKLIPLAAGGQTTDVNEPEEPGTCVARSPTDGIAVVGSANGSSRIYRITDLKMRTEKQKDPNRVKEVERLSGPVNAIAFARDGTQFAVAATGEARVFKKNGDRSATLAGASGPVYAVAFSPDGTKVYTAGFDATVRVYEAKGGKLVGSFTPTPFGQLGPAASK